MSLKPGAETLDELILQPTASSQLLGTIPSGPRALPPAAQQPPPPLPPRMPFPESGWHGTTEMSSEATFSFILIAF